MQHRWPKALSVRLTLHHLKVSSTERSVQIQLVTVKRKGKEVRCWITLQSMYILKHVSRRTT
jgi:hypothetical protein